LVYSGFYRKRASTSFVRDLVGIARAMLLGSLVIMAATYLTRTVTYSRAVILIFWPLSAVLVTLGRAVGRAAHSALRGGLFDLRRIVIVGGDQDAVDLKSRLISAGRGEYDFVGYVLPRGREARPDMRPLLGEASDIGALVTEHRVNQVFVCDRRLSRAEIGPVVVSARRVGAEVIVVSEVTDILIRGSQLEDIGGVPVVVFPAASLSGVRLATKRVSDLLFSLLGMVLLAALTPVVLVAQTLTYRQYTRLARSFMQFGLVLSGRMSLAGPSRAISGESLRPGITGPWLTAPRLSGEDRDRLDVYYLQNWSLSYDVEIMLESLKQLGGLFGRRGEPGSGGEGAGAGKMGGRA
jgi:hypothetical protein